MLSTALNFGLIKCLQLGLLYTFFLFSSSACIYIEAPTNLNHAFVGPIKAITLPTEFFSICRTQTRDLWLRMEQSHHCITTHIGGLLYTDIDWTKIRRSLLFVPLKMYHNNWETNKVNSGVINIQSFLIKDFKDIWIFEFY